MDYSRGVLDPLCPPLFPKLRKQLGPFFVDKTKLIEKIVDNGLNGKADLVLRPRRCGKSTMLHMLKWLHQLTFTLWFWSLSSRSFFCIPLNGDPDPHLLFNGLYIESKHDICREHMGKYAVVFCDFKVRYFLWTVQTTYLCKVGYFRYYLGAYARVLQNHGCESLWAVASVS